MKNYNNLRDGLLLKRLVECLNYEHLLKTAIPVSNSQNPEINKECIFDFSGISALLLHDKNDENLLKVQDQVEKILESQDIFNEKGVRLHFRFLLVFPYSAHAIARIQAETSKNRATIKEPALNINRYQVDFVDRKAFDSSFFMVRQQNFLEYIENLMDKYQLSDHSLNRIVVRFVPMAVNLCLYRINDVIFSAPYLLAKDWRIDKKCVTKSPVTELNRTEDKDTFDALLDHFRYLWELPVTLNMRDATHYDPNKTYGLSRIKKPDDIDFKNKAHVIRSKQTKNNNSSSLHSWKLQVKNQLKQLCPTIPEFAPTEELIFIACSWKKEEIDKFSPSSPNSFAVKIKSWLEHDLAQDLKVVLVDAPAGSSVSKEIYENLNSSTVGIILFTADYVGDDGQWYSRPNIYHEYGYLQARFASDGFGSNKVIPIRQCKGGKTTIIPSNINGTSAISLEDDKIEAIYGTLLVTIRDLLNIDSHRLCRALVSHKDRINKMILVGEVEQAIGQSWVRRLDNQVSNLSCGKCSMEDCKDRDTAFDD